MNIACPRCTAGLVVEHADGTEINCPACGHGFAPSAPKKGFAAAVWRGLDSAFASKPPTHICVTCHSVGFGVKKRRSDWGSAGLFFIGLVLLAFVPIIGVILIAVALINSTVATLNKPKLCCLACGSEEMIPIDSPRAATLLS